MARCYSGAMRSRQPPIRALPQIWLLSDARNDAALERALRRLPRGSGFIFRHYHLPAAQRRARFIALARLARSRGHVVILAGSKQLARQWRADGSYGPPAAGHIRSGQLRLVTAHSLRELRQCGAGDAVLLSPVFPTRTHPGARVLGPGRFRLLAARSPLPVIALGGMTHRRARQLGVPRWAAIDGLCAPPRPA